MPHIPKSRATQKDLRNTIRLVQEIAGSSAASAANRAKEDAKRRAKLFQDLKTKEMLLSSITKQIALINYKNNSDSKDMYAIVKELCDVEMMNKIVCEVSNKIEIFDKNPEHTTKINSTGINLSKTIERVYLLYMIEFLVRAEAERMREKRICTQEIISVLKLDKEQDFESRGKAIRCRVRAVVRHLYGLPEEEQKFDKLREETRTVMRNVAAEIDFKQKQSTVEQTDPDASDR